MMHSSGLVPFRLQTCKLNLENHSFLRHLPRTLTPPISAIIPPSPSLRNSSLGMCNIRLLYLRLHSENSHTLAGSLFPCAGETTNSATRQPGARYARRGGHLLILQEEGDAANAPFGLLLHPKATASWSALRADYVRVTPSGTPSLPALVGCAGLLPKRAPKRQRRGQDGEEHRRRSRKQKKAKAARAAEMAEPAAPAARREDGAAAAAALSHRRCCRLS